MDDTNSLIRLIVKETMRVYRSMREASTSGGVAGYSTPNAFSATGKIDMGRLKKTIKSSGYTITNEKFDKDKYNEPFLNTGADLGNNTVNENRWLELKNDDTRNSYRKIADGTTYVRRQLREISKYLRWYGRVKNENELTPMKYHTRAQKNIESISELVHSITEQLQSLKHEE